MARVNRVNTHSSYHVKLKKTERQEATKEGVTIDKNVNSFDMINF
jgi:hypothetical protein